MIKTAREINEQVKSSVDTEINKINSNVVLDDKLVERKKEVEFELTSLLLDIQQKSI